MKKDNNLVYQEIQRPRQIWIWLPLLLCAGIMWYLFIQQIIFGVPVGNNPAPDLFMIIFWFIFGVFIPIFTLGIKLVVEVRHDGIYVRFYPFPYKRFLFKDMNSYESITYNSIKRFGGWGLRINMNGEKAYNIYGNKGMKLKLKYETVVIGTQKPEALEAAIQTVFNRQSSDQIKV
ncbi:DUF6141 family protein [Oceanobacillus jeddahense]|uniref:DUF6141 family protein n=1 Tax=Oceanobacillus jeddahense TaxID=1462527 RepID=UPI000595E931|nr:DUF6141 family protein [Oceanobacillus jeddahense]